MKAYIKSLSYYLPDKTLTNEQLSKEHPEWNAEKISQKTGINIRHIAGEDEFASDMGEKAVLQVLKESKINREDIDFLIYCTQSPDYFLPTTACILQNRLGLKTSCGALDFNLGCSGFVYGLSVAKGLIFARMARNVLLITSETYSKYIHPLDKSNKTIFGDAAAATIISAEEGKFEIGEFSFGTDGNGAENLIVRHGGIKYRKNTGNDQFNDDGEFIRNDDYIFMNGGEIFSFTSKAVPILVNNVIQNNNLVKDDINKYIFHQANKYMLDFIRRKIGIEQEKFVYYIENVGNTVSSTIPIALKETCYENTSGIILLAGFGVGYSWAGCIIKPI